MTNKFEHLHYMIESGGAYKRYLELMGKKQQEAKDAGDNETAQKISDKYLNYTNGYIHPGVSSSPNNIRTRAHKELYDGDIIYRNNDRYVDINKNNRQIQKNARSYEGIREEMRYGKAIFLDDLNKRKLETFNKNKNKENEDHSSNVVDTNDDKKIQKKTDSTTRKN